VLASAESTFVAVPPEDVARLKARYGMRRLIESPDTTGRGDEDGGRPALDDQRGAPA